MPRSQGTSNTLDASWDRKLARGLVAPDLTIDLHGYTLSTAHAELEAGLTRAVAMQARLILLITGRPPPLGRSRLDNPLRGVIRARSATGSITRATPAGSRRSATRIRGTAGRGRCMWCCGG